MFKVAIIGSRSILLYDSFKSRVDHLLSNKDKIQIINSGSVGPDRFPKIYAEDVGAGYFEVLPNFRRFGKDAINKRNEQILKQADAVIAFSDNQFVDVNKMVEAAKAKGLPVKVCRVD